MTLADAIKIAEQAKPKHRQPLDKLQRANTTAAQFSTGVTALAKSFSEIGDTVTSMQKRLDHFRDAVEYLQDFRPNQPLRRFQS